MSRVFAIIIMLLVGTVMVSCAASATGLAGEKPPVLPRVFYQDAKSVLIQPVKARVVKIRAGSIFSEGLRIAVIRFGSPEKTQGGVLVSDMFATQLRQQKLQVFERDRVDRILGEQQLAIEGKVALTDLEIAQALGQLESIDYMVFGAVTLYKSEPQSIYLPIKILNDDRPRYIEQYIKYRNWYLKGWFPFRFTYFLSDDEKLKRLRGLDDVWSLEDLENEYRKISKLEFRVIATVGISAKVVDVKTGEIVWSGQAETNDFTLVDGSRRILEEFLLSIQSSSN